ncbi:MAG: tRNA guanosine(34) transglycosylase Tgt, partial [Planctomycetota bacterium]|nr:tRNA guanosine(34) transglycosylase Tgt [Planctomycetota bacterium]
MTEGFGFRIFAKDATTRARTGVLETPHGRVETPAFLPVGTAATVKAATPADLERAGVPMILCNTYHLAQRPGSEVVRRAGGLHAFMGWSRPILTDSGGFQVFSLSSFCEVSEEGVRFRSPLDGTMFWLTPEEAIRLQQDLGSDIALQLDVCSPNPCPKDQAAEAMHLTHRWAERSLASHNASRQALFGIVQGGIYPELRSESAEQIGRLGFDGIAVGGLSVGEEKSDLEAVLRSLRLPDPLPRHLLGVGKPEDLLLAIGEGMDMFDCVIPTRNARGAGLYTFAGRLHLRNRKFKEDFDPVEADCPCPACTQFSRAYLRHLFGAREI